MFDQDRWRGGAVILLFDLRKEKEIVAGSGNLGKEETTELIKRTFGEQTISPEFADLLYQRTGGNPFFDWKEILQYLSSWFVPTLHL